MKHLTLFASSLQCGGAERVLVMLAEGFQQQGYRVSVITLSGKDSDFYSLPEGVTRIALDVMGNSANPVAAISNNLKRYARLRQAVQQLDPDAIISFVARENITLLLALWGTSYPIFVTEHNDQRFRTLSQPWSTIRRLVYPRATAVVSVSEGVNQYFDWLPKTQKAVIYNPFTAPNAESLAIDTLPPGVDPSKKWLLSMGRLIEQKGFDYLLEAWAMCHSNSDWQLIVLGDGELKPQLLAQKERLGLGNEVVFAGKVKKPFALMNRGEFFVMASRFEGFPMAHGEALACGLPVVATDCPSGPAEIVRDGVDGILVPPGDVTALATAIEKLISNQELRSNLSAKAQEVTQRFSISKVIADWEVLFARNGISEK